MERLPSQEKIWKKYYNKDEYKIERQKRTVYQEIINNNKKFEKDLAIEYFGTNIKFKSFFDNINKTAKSFEEYGVKKGDFVTICAAGIPEIAYSFYALSKIGAVANMIAPYFDKTDLVERIEDCESDILIIMDKFYPVLKETIKKSRIKKIIILPTLNSSILKYISKSYKIEDNKKELYWNQFIKDSKNRIESNTVKYEKNLPLAMVYSSGTTGSSKGILLSNDSFQNSVHAYPASGVDISRNQKFYQLIPPWYSTGLNTSMHLPLTYGCSLFMDPRFEREVFVKNVIKHKPNYTVAPTSMYEGFLDKNLVKNHDLSFYNYPFEGGEPLRNEVATKIEKVFKEHNCNSKLRVAYGQCECGAAITTQTQQIDHERGSVGIPLPGVTIGIFDDNYNELTYNKRGNILVNTPCSMMGYYNNKEETNKYFFYNKNVRWNQTGDLGYITENGELFVEGRASDYSIIDGKKIYNFDIENIIYNFKEIKICDVLEKNNNLVVHLVLNDDYSKVVNNFDQIKELLERIQRNIHVILNDTSFVPTIFKFRNDFPYAPSGKRDIKKLKEEKEDFIFYKDGILEKYEFDNVKKKVLTKE